MKIKGGEIFPVYSMVYIVQTLMMKIFMPPYRVVGGILFLSYLSVYTLLVISFKYNSIFERTDSQGDNCMTNLLVPCICQFVV